MPATYHRVVNACILSAALGLVVASPAAQVAVPTRPAKPIFQSGQGKLRPLEITFDRETQKVTLTLSVQDPNGYFIPNLRRDNFAVYEDGVQQKPVTVDIEHARVALGTLLEGGGRYQQLNKILSSEMSYVAHPLLDAVQPDDKIAMFSYASTVETLADFDQPFDKYRLDALLNRLPSPAFSEANLYDAFIEVSNRMQPVTGRKAILLISTGIDTFSKASFEEALATAERSGTPVYSIGLAGVVKRMVIGDVGPLSKIDWSRGNDQLKILSQVSGGRAYLRDTDLEIPAIYDDLMENLRVRYVITYVSSNPASSGPARSVRVELVNSSTGVPLRIVDAGGKAITARVSVQGQYTP